MALLAVGGRAEALLVVADRSARRRRAALAALAELGLGVTLVSGDTRATTAAVAGRLGVAASRRSGRRSEKRELVAARQAAGARVLVVGDGINDAPGAHPGRRRGGHGARHRRDHGERRRGAGARRPVAAARPGPARAGATTGIIRQNVFWAFFYNVVAIPLAVAGVLHPIVGAAAMAASSAFVVTNSLRLARDALPKRE